MPSKKGWTLDHLPDDWRWCYVYPDTGKEKKRSPGGFKTLVDCINDATPNGYERPGANLSPTPDPT